MHQALRGNVWVISFYLLQPPLRAGCVEWEGYMPLGQSSLRESEKSNIIRLEESPLSLEAFKQRLGLHVVQGRSDVTCNWTGLDWLTPEARGCGFLFWKMLLGKEGTRTFIFTQRESRK